MCYTKVLINNYFLQVFFFFLFFVEHVYFSYI